MEKEHIIIFSHEGNSVFPKKWAGPCQSNGRLLPGWHPAAFQPVIKQLRVTPTVFGALWSSYPQDNHRRLNFLPHRVQLSLFGYHKITGAVQYECLLVSLELIVSIHTFQKGGVIHGITAVWFIYILPYNSPAILNTGCHHDNRRHREIWETD